MFFAVNLLLASLPLAIRAIALAVMKGAVLSFESIFFTPDPFFFVAIYSSGNLVRIFALEDTDRNIRNYGMDIWQKLSLVLLVSTALLGLVLYGIMLSVSLTTVLQGGDVASLLEASKVAKLAAVLMGVSLIASLLFELRRV